MKIKQTDREKYLIRLAEERMSRLIEILREELGLRIQQEETRDDKERCWHPVLVEISREHACESGLYIGGSGLLR